MNLKEKITLWIIIALFIIFSGSNLFLLARVMELKRESQKNSTSIHELYTQTLGLDNALRELQTQTSTQMRELRTQAEELQKLKETVKLPSYLMRRTGLSLEWAKTIIHESETRNIPLDLWLGNIEYESNFNPNEKNPESSATGLCQFLHSTARWVAAQMGLPFSPEMLKDPVYSTRLAGWYLEYLYKQTGSWYKAFYRYGDQTNTYVPTVVSRGAIYRKELQKLSEDK
jgi:soluble lytic murein transglycosylase-like protein